MCIALISIVVAVYAIGASYLGRETLRSKWRKKKRREILERKVKELGPKADVEGIQEEIDRYKKEIAEIDDKLSSLNVWRAVIFPSGLFLAALIGIVYNIYVDPIGTITIPTWGGESVILVRDLLTGIAILCIVAGIFFLAKTLFAIEWAASRIPLPEFKVTFTNDLTTNRYRIEEEVAIGICVENIGEDVAENLEIYTFFHSKFYIRPGKGYRVVPQGATNEFPGYNAAIQEVNLLHMGTNLELDHINVKMPKDTGSYEIPVGISERKIGHSVYKLNLEIYS